MWLSLLVTTSFPQSAQGPRRRRSHAEQAETKRTPRKAAVRPFRQCRPCGRREEGREISETNSGSFNALLVSEIS